MIDESTVRAWYTPVEVTTLRRWLIVSFLVNVFLLSVDVLRGGGTLALGLAGLLLIGVFRAQPGADPASSAGDAARG